MAQPPVAPLAPRDAPDSNGSGLLPRTVEASQDYLAAIVGQETRAGERLQAGPILKLMYDTAVAVAFRHCGRRPVMQRMDRIDLTRLICHMDLVRIEGRMVETAGSSMVIEVRCYTKRLPERDFSPCHVGFFTMVAIDGEGHPVRSIPDLSFDTPEGRVSKALAEHRRAQIEERRNALAWTSSDEHLRVQDVVEPMEAARYDYLTPAETEVRVKGQISPTTLQPDGRVLAGDLLMSLDRVAGYTARKFCRNEHLVTLSLNDLVFTRPLHATDRIEFISRVTYVRRHTLEVAVDIVVHTLQGESIEMDRVEFFLINFSASGSKRRITTGLTLTEDEQDSLRMYLKARTRFNFWKAHPESHLSQLPD